MVLSQLFGNHGTLTKIHTNFGLVQALAVLGTSAVAALYARERVYFWLFRDRIPVVKRQPLSAKSLFHLVQTGAISMLSFFIMFKCSAVYWTPFQPLSMHYWFPIVVPFFAILLLRDVVFLLPLHSRMHTPRFWRFHKFHHEIHRNAQSLHAFHLDALDLIIENVGAPFLLLATQRLLGMPVGVHWLTGAMLTFHDGGLHSINPYSIMYFNPILDHNLEPNVMHQLHHAINKGYYGFVPFHHLIPQRRRADCDRYNELFQTDFTFS